MRACWIPEGQDVDVGKMRRNRISAPCFSIRDPLCTREHLREVLAEGLFPRVYFAWNWWPGDSGAQLAGRVSATVSSLFPQSAPDFPPVCADLEAHDVAYLLSFWREWRRLRPQRQSDWTLESFQGGLFTPAQASELVRLVRGDVRWPGFVCPQFYSGSMQPLAADRSILDLVIHGFDAGALQGFYDGARLPFDTAYLGGQWSGYVFDQGRLP